MLNILTFFEKHSENIIIFFRIFAFIVCYIQSKRIAQRFRVQRVTVITACLMLAYLSTIWILTNINFSPEIKQLYSYIANTYFFKFSILPCAMPFFPLVILIVYFLRKYKYCTTPYSFFIWRSAMVNFLFDTIIIIVLCSPGS